MQLRQRSFVQPLAGIGLDCFALAVVAAARTGEEGFALPGPGCSWRRPLQESVLVADMQTAAALRDRRLAVVCMAVRIRPLVDNLGADGSARARSLLHSRGAVVPVQNRS